jgi:hypothetical protein
LPTAYPDRSIEVYPENNPLSGDLGKMPSASNSPSQCSPIMLPCRNHDVNKIVESPLALTRINLMQRRPIADPFKLRQQQQKARIGLRT